MHIVCIVNALKTDFLCIQYVFNIHFFGLKYFVFRKLFIILGCKSKDYG